MTNRNTIDRITKNEGRIGVMMRLSISMNRMNQQQQLIVKTDNGLFVLCL